MFPCDAAENIAFVLIESEEKYNALIKYEIYKLKYVIAVQ
tara:strand:- start:493 stop:612 length:120 start_codon:yes stop_codon:yes gene_type:complete